MRQSSVSAHWPSLLLSLKVLPYLVKAWGLQYFQGTFYPCDTHIAAPHQLQYSQDQRVSNIDSLNVLCPGRHCRSTQEEKAMCWPRLLPPWWWYLFPECFVIFAKLALFRGSLDIRTSRWELGVDAPLILGSATISCTNSREEVSIQSHLQPAAWD